MFTEAANFSRNAVGHAVWVPLSFRRSGIELEPAYRRAERIKVSVTVGNR